MAGYVRGSIEHLEKLMDVIAESCDNIENRSEENEQDVRRIMDSMKCIYLDFIAKYAVTKRVNEIKEIDVPEFMK